MIFQLFAAIFEAAAQSLAQCLISQTFKKVLLYIGHLNLMNSGAIIKDFVTVSVIGKGTYAKVLLVRYSKDNHLYALKVLKKKYIL